MIVRSTVDGEVRLSTATPPNEAAALPTETDGTPIVAFAVIESGEVGALLTTETVLETAPPGPLEGA